MRRQWTRLQLADLVRRIAAGWQDYRIAEYTGRTQESIRQRRRRLAGKIGKGK